MSTSTCNQIPTARPRRRRRSGLGHADLYFSSRRENETGNLFCFEGVHIVVAMTDVYAVGWLEIRSEVITVGDRGPV